MNKKINVKIAGWINSSCGDGPGIRSVIFFQGCSRKCRSCQNANTHDPTLGNTYEIEQLMDMIDSNCFSRMLTISGGEPLEQLEGLRLLLVELKKKDYNVCLYTGARLEDVPKWVLEKVDFIKVGAFVEKMKDNSLPYYGSRNQKLLEVQNGKVTKEVV